jgi:aminoglycoside 6'-N-acetyltransferase
VNPRDPRPAESDLRFRPLVREDFGDLERWLSAPHVRLWWGEPLDAAGVEKEFGPCIDGVDPTLVFITTLAHRPIGMVQAYLLSDNPDYEAAVGVRDAAGMDLFIGEPDLLGVGIGKAIVRTFVTDIGWGAFPRVKRFMAGPSARNLRSRRSFEAAGFACVGLVDVAGEPDPQAVMVLERDPVPDSVSEPAP